MSHRAPHLAGATPPNRFAPLAPVRRGHLLNVIAVLPGPEQYAYHLNSREHHALKTAWQARTGWRVGVEFQVELGREGLCEAHGPHLTNFGMQVRKVVMREDA